MVRRSNSSWSVMPLAVSLCMSVSSLSSLSLSLSLSLRLLRLSWVCSASVYLRRALCFLTMPRVAPPRLGTLVKPWQRWNRNTVTWLKTTLLLWPLLSWESFGLFRMERMGRWEVGEAELKSWLSLLRLSSSDSHSEEAEEEGEEEEEAEEDGEE